jgi:hypothetical protein
MFEQEMELEKHQSSVVPLLLISLLILGVIGIAGYFVVENRRVMTKPEAEELAVRLLTQQRQPTVLFHTGNVSDGYDENARDPRYRLLEKAGVVKIGKSKAGATPVELTPKGEEMLKAIAGVQESDGKNNTKTYIVPLAERKLVVVSGITKTGTGRALMEYSWQWQPNALGESFDASGAVLQSFNTWDRATIIQKHGGTFYHQAPTKVVIAAVLSDKGWQPAQLD